ncbi:aspartokinase II [Proteiniborus sp. DW1]|uniref:aspartate kinase n=1 Tax=Proteiniborus sp. DW1 TaxID=1889883 RepID=UPI00092E1348|nr:aspartate kinase [Proteiniborus sp. DW1]SCG83862.1 aspartokinase II [Proteiniborus sp. DW1]
MSTIVQKYGGTAVGTVENMQRIADEVIRKKQEGYNIVIVVSAMGKTTDNLIEMAKSISNNPCKRDLDMLMATGEQVSISLLSMIFNEKGYDAISLIGAQAGIRTEGIHTRSRIVEIDIGRVKRYLEEGKIVVVAGFQGINEFGDITTLGRGGSDTTAVALAAKLQCTCEIYTDVEGIYSVDPRLFPEAKKLDYISYEEMMEMSSLGAKVMESRSVEIACKYKIPIYVASSHKRTKGTYIKEIDKDMEQKSITGLSVSDNVLMVTISRIPYSPENISKIFGKLASQEVNIDMISQTSPQGGYVNISFTANKEDEPTVNRVMEELKNEIFTMEVKKDNNITKISVIGMGMRNEPGVASKVFHLFADNSINFKQVTTSEISISYTIDASDKQKAINVLCKAFNL